MTEQRHIINEQLLEVHIPKEANVYAMQEKVARLYREKLVPVIDQQLSDRYGSDEKKHYQIDKLTIDMGKVQLEDMETVFTKKFAAAIAVAQDQVSPKDDDVTADGDTPGSTPLRVLSYYLMSGVLPWWVGDTTKAYLHEQFDELCKTQDNTFKELLGQLRYNSTYLNRFLNTFTEERLLKALQLLLSVPMEDLYAMKNKFMKLIRKTPGEWSHGLTDFRIAKALWTAAFNQAHTVRGNSDLESRSIHQALQILGADLKTAENETVPVKLTAIQSQVVRLKKQYPDNRAWQQFFEYLLSVLYSPTVHLVHTRFIEALKLLLTNLEEAQHKSVQWQQRRKQPVEEPGTGTDAHLKTVTETNLQPLVRHLHVLETTLKQLQPVSGVSVIEKLSSGFEDTDFIPVHNAGLVILWPFLQRFFENLDVMTDKAFYDEAAVNKAACALQYLAEEGEGELFEGKLILNKVLCGIPPEATVEPLLLSTEEKAIAEGLLQAVISRGPHWKRLSSAGFRTSYLQREGSLRSRDGHWLLQVKKETYDVTLEKLPWGFATVKLPWMQEPLMVEWI